MKNPLTIKNLRHLLLFFLIISGFTVKGFSEETKLYDPVALYLTWQREPETTMTINWVTDLDSKNDLVEYRRSEKEKWSQITGEHRRLPENTPYLLHRVEITALHPNTIYEFRVGNSAIIHKFHTMPADLTHPIRFVAGGDMYHDGLDLLHETNRQAAITAPMFALVGGDIAYASDKLLEFLPNWMHPLIDHFIRQKFDRWLEWLIAWKEDMIRPDGCLIPMLPAIGNHDTIGRYGQTPDQSPFFYTLFPMPGKPGYNVLDFSNYMSIFILDSGHTNPIAGKQTEWLKRSMQQRMNIPHKFALYHVPAYPSVHRLDKEISTQIRKFWVPSFDTYRLTAAFENHEHAYKRTHLIRGGAVSAYGVMYIGDGGWGVEHPRKPRRLNDKWYLAKAASARHFLVVDVEQDKQTVHAVNSEGEVIDSASW